MYICPSSFYIYLDVSTLTIISTSHEEKGNINMKFNEELVEAGALELTNSELESVSGGWGHDHEDFPYWYQPYWYQPRPWWYEGGGWGGDWDRGRGDWDRGRGDWDRGRGDWRSRR
jgi:hypothetical protein